MFIFISTATSVHTVGASTVLGLTLPDDRRQRGRNEHVWDHVHDAVFSLDISQCHVGQFVKENLTCVWN